MYQVYEDNNVPRGSAQSWGGTAAGMLTQAQDASNMAAHYQHRIRSMEDVADLPSVSELVRESYASHPNDSDAAYLEGVARLDTSFRTQETSLANVKRYEKLSSYIAENLTKSDYLADAVPPRFRAVDDYDFESLRNEQMASDARAKAWGLERIQFSTAVVNSHKELYKSAFGAELSTLYPGLQTWVKDRMRGNHLIASENYMGSIRDQLDYGRVLPHKLHRDLSEVSEYRLAARTLHDLVRSSKRGIHPVGEHNPYLYD
jgi:hypothetical protein